MTYRKQRFISTLKQSLGDILLNEIHNPELQFISISEVSISNDLKKARIYVSSPTQNIENIIEQLNKAKGFIKKRLPEKMSLKYVPVVPWI
ncbi:ribosome-binding factor A [Candidatus Methanophagaceae archaeon]|nr:ribosome-binding factor A [Methanophagales archaeon]